MVISAYDKYKRGKKRNKHDIFLVFVFLICISCDTSDTVQVVMMNVWAIWKSNLKYILKKMDFYLKKFLFNMSEGLKTNVALTNFNRQPSLLYAEIHPNY